MMAFWILGAFVIASAVWTITAKQAGLQRRRAAAELRDAGGALRHALGGVLGRDPDHRVLRCDSGAVRVRDRAARAAAWRRSRPDPNRLPNDRSSRRSSFVLAALGFSSYAVPRTPCPGQRPHARRRSDRSAPPERLRQRCRLRQGALHRAAAAVRSHRADPAWSPSSAWSRWPATGAPYVADPPPRRRGRARRCARRSCAEGD